MSKPNYSHLVLVLDASGSMGTVERSVKRSIIAFLKAQNQIDGEITVSVCIFDGDVNDRTAHFLDVPEAIRHIKSEYYSRGATALYDAIGVTAHEVASKLQRLPDSEQPEKIIFAIVTDGYNSSGCNHRGYTIKSVRDIINHHEEVYDWEFLFIGANQNAYQVGKNFGIKAGKALSFVSTDGGIESAMNAISGAVSRYRLNGAPNANQFFSSDDHAFQQALGASASPVSE